MNISAANNLIPLPASTLPATRERPTRPEAVRSETVLPTAGLPVIESGPRSQADQWRADQIRGRLAENSAHNPATRQAMNEYLSIEEFARREELSVLGVDVYA